MYMWEVMYNVGMFGIWSENNHIFSMVNMFSPTNADIRRYAVIHSLTSFDAIATYNQHKQRF